MFRLLFVTLVDVQRSLDRSPRCEGTGTRGDLAGNIQYVYFPHGSVLQLLHASTRLPALGQSSQNK